MWVHLTGHRRPLPKATAGTYATTAVGRVNANALETTQPISAGCAPAWLCYGRCHTALVVRVLSAPSKSLLDGSLKPGPGTISLIKHTRVYAFCNLQVMPFPMILNLAHSLETLDPRVPDSNEKGLVGYVDTKLVQIHNFRVLAYKTAD